MNFEKISDLKYLMGSEGVENLLSINNVLTQEEVEKYAKQGYSIGIVKEELAKKMPGVNINNIYFTNVFPPKTVYYDKNKYIYKELPIFGGKFLIPNKQKPEECIFNIVKHMESFFEKKDMSNLLLHAPDRIKIDFVKQMVEDCFARKIEIPDLYNIFKGCYTLCDYGFKDITKGFIDRVVSYKTKEDKEKTISKLKEYPDKVTVYRGEGNKSTNYTESYSWSTNISVAYFFAAKNSIDGRIIEATVDKKKIIEYISNRNENEVLIYPSDIELKKITNLYSLKDIDEVLGQTRYEIDDYMVELNHLKFSSGLQGHNKEHCQRVLFLAFLIKNMEGIELLDYELDVLGRVCIYHDIARKTDYEDEEHGRNSYEIFRVEYDDDEIVKFLMEYHCKDDAEANDYLEKSNIVDKESVKKLYKIIKDADALDRVRFGLRELDINYLRYSQSKKLVIIANELLNINL